MTEDEAGNFLLERTCDGLRLDAKALGVRVSREHYLWLASQIECLRATLKAVDHTLCVHGHLDVGTELHDRLSDILATGQAAK